ncbi:GatB/YqeY domain-containing protein [Phytoactinopolyspora endophytica]|uniref:GatB/YqeY domain-containing protein n=1 Tax=Phytoactinopolyspora endophytica TaxID=1642495 RepID=UPI00101C2965|nr:GatB/YqeY domain-containing protein [Phytoactinopolyspora endophytica]
MTTNIKETLQRELTASVRARDDVRKRTLRIIMGLIHSAEARDATVENPVARDLSDDEILEVLSGEAERRKRVIATYQETGQNDRARTERDELAVLETYL